MSNVLMLCVWALTCLWIKTKYLSIWNYHKYQTNQEIFLYIGDNQSQNPRYTIMRLIFAMFQKKGLVKISSQRFDIETKINKNDAHKIKTCLFFNFNWIWSIVFVTGCQLQARMRFPKLVCFERIKYWKNFARRYWSFPMYRLICRSKKCFW